MTARFSYIGKGYTLPEFQAYVQSYDFGSVPPDFVVFHHTAKPDASWAPAPGGKKATQWDEKEAGKSREERYAMRKKRLDGARDFYAQTLGWVRGPHLFIDNEFIWLFTPMAEVGIHAKWGNQFTKGGRMHYSIGIEVIGHYERVEWPDDVAALVGGAVAALKRKLNTFNLSYLYPRAAMAPGRAINTKGEEYCPHPERLLWGGLSSHRDYNKPACPGAAITEAFYTQVCLDAWDQLVSVDVGLKQARIAAPSGTFRYCSSTVAQFYETNGGLRTFGYPLTDEFLAEDNQHERCGWFVCENGIIKRKPNAPAGWNVRLAPMDEQVQRWRARA